MEWTDQGIIVACRPHGETSLVCDLFTHQRGRHLGLVRGGRGRRMRPICQVGNVVDAVWRARLDEHLGTYTFELTTPVASRFFDEPITLSALRTICHHLTLFPERDPHKGLYKGAHLLLSHLEDKDIWPGLLVRFELEILRELGVGLDLSECAATGTQNDLIYVSPKSGRAVSRQGGAPYASKLLSLPAFLIGEQENIKTKDILNGLKLTGHFFEKHFTKSSGISPSEKADLLSRQQLIALYERAAPCISEG